MPAERAESGAGSTAPSSANGSAVNGRPAHAISPGVLEAEQVRNMFDRIAVVYDVLNTAMTAGLHHHWRARAADLARVGPGSRVLDVATGTGDLALELARRVAPGGEVIGSDFSEGMLARARVKAGVPDPGPGGGEHVLGDYVGSDPAEGAGGGNASDGGEAANSRPAARAELCFEWGDALRLPYGEDSFDAATVGFGARNFSDLGRGLAEMVRVVRPGGRVVVLEMTTPTEPPLSIFFRIWFDRLVPVLGRLTGSIAAMVARLRGSTADGTIAAAYTYLPNSVKRFPGPAALAGEMERAGLSEISYLLTAGGIVAIHAGTVAPEGAR